MTVSGARVHTRIGRRYEVLDLIGQGGFGRVYRCRQLGDQGFSKIVAVKLGTAPTLGGGAVGRLCDEAKVLSLVRHRAIVHVDDLVELEEGPAIVMEFVDGLDLTRILSCEPLPLGPAAEVVSEVAGALDCAQRARGPGGHPLLLEHRDVKPANIMITVNGETKLLDFGVAHANLVDEDQGNRPSCGSRGYVAPERLRGETHFNSDIYSLGVVFFEMLTGTRFGSPPQQEAAHAAWCRRALRALPAGVPPGARRLLVDMLAWSPDARPTAREVERRAYSITRTAVTSLRDWAELRMAELRFGFAAEVTPSDTPSAADTWPPTADGVPNPLPTLKPSIGLVPRQPPEPVAPPQRFALSPLLLGLVLLIWATSAALVQYTTAMGQPVGEIADAEPPGPE